MCPRPHHMETCDRRKVLKLEQERVIYERKKVTARLLNWQKSSLFPPPTIKKTFPLKKEEIISPPKIQSLYKDNYSGNNLNNNELYLLYNKNNLKGQDMFLLADFNSNQGIITPAMVQEANLLAHKGFVFFNGLNAGNSIFTPAHVQIIRSEDNIIKPRYFTNTFDVMMIPQIYKNLQAQNKRVTLIFLGQEKVGIIEHKLANLSQQDQLWYFLLGPSAIELGSNAMISKLLVLEQIKDIFPCLELDLSEFTMEAQKKFFSKISEEVRS